MTTFLDLVGLALAAYAIRVLVEIRDEPRGIRRGPAIADGKLDDASGP